MAQNSASLRANLYRSSRSQNKWASDLAKRLLDISAAGLGLLALAPFFALIAIWIKRDSPGPVFYRGPRYGKGGRTFGILKFRTMREEPESYQGPRVTAEDDPRVTPLGKWLRDSKINELPQLWNVLKGEMSLVGPRPEDPEIGQTWPREAWSEILSVRPGITSPASVLYRDEETMLKAGQVMHTYMEYVAPSKMRLDQLYVRNRSFWLDLDILFWTSLILLPKAGEHKPPEDSLFLGPASRLARRYMNWFVIDAMVSLAAMAATGVIWRSFGPLNVGLPEAIALATGFALIFSLAGVVLKVNRISWSQASLADASELAPALLLATLIALLGNQMMPNHPPLHPGMILMAAMAAGAGFVAVRFRSRLLSAFAERWLAWRQDGTEAARERALVVGGGESGQFAAWMLEQRKRSTAMKLVGFVDDDLYKQGARIRGREVLGRSEDIPRIAEEHDIGVIVFAIHNITAEERRRLLGLCAETKARVVVLPDIQSALGRARNEEEEAPAAWQQGKLACHYCLMRSSPVETERWLAELDETAQRGDMGAVREKIRTLRGMTN